MTTQGIKYTHHIGHTRYELLSQSVLFQRPLASNGLLYNLTGMSYLKFFTIKVNQSRLLEREYLGDLLRLWIGTKKSRDGANKTIEFTPSIVT